MMAGLIRGKAAQATSLLLLMLWFSGTGYAHPMGNFSINHYSKITIEDGLIEIRYVIDMAEIPTYQEAQQGGIAAQPDDPRLHAFLLAKGEALKRGLVVAVNGKPIQLRLVSQEIIFPPGAGGLPTMKMGFVYQGRAQGDGSTAELKYADTNFLGRAGWKEIIVSASAGTLVSSSVPQKDRSMQLSNYPTDMLNSPPQDLMASISFKSSFSQFATQRSSTSAGATSTQPLPIASARKLRKAHRPIASSPSLDKGVKEREALPRRSTENASVEPIHLEANKQSTPRSAFTELIAAKNLGPWFLFTAAVIAMFLGALHALEPGHGKTMVAAYLVGSRGTARHAVLLGIIVTAAHTAGVFALGAITLYASHYVVPEQLYPWMGAISGLTITGLGAYMFLRRWTGADGEHSHAPGQSHSHWFAREKSALQPSAPSTQNTGPVSLSQLLVLGITGGIIPCPAALVVLLSAFALHRIGLGFFLIVAFSVGLAAVLIIIGILMVYARRFVSRIRSDGILITRWLPLTSSAFMMVLGVAIAFRALATAGIGAQVLTREKMGPFLFIIGLGLFLGMRHSTDPDHVVAISTFISKQRDIRRAALIGVLWGLGHTLTIFVVGAAIIVFGVVIPPRLGLSMEFSVALMLILLGILNLTGVMNWVRRHFAWRSQALSTPGDRTPAEIQEQASRPGTVSLLDRTARTFGLYQWVRPLLVGIVHGLAGSAAVALLILSTIHSPFWATAYLLVFGAGTLVGMVLMTTAMAVPLAYAGNRFTRVSRYLGITSGVFSLAFGGFLVYQIGFLGGLFSSSPQWTPH